MEVKINIKPLSVNRCWYGRMFKTKAYLKYQEELAYQLPRLEMPNKIYLKLKIGFSNKLSDIDNCLKPMLDIFQFKFGFNDRDIYKLEIEKEIVKKGEEYIKFEFEKYENPES